MRFGWTLGMFEIDILGSNLVGFRCERVFLVVVKERKPY